MTAQLLASELANLIQESKRKHNDLRQVCTTHCAGDGVDKTPLYVLESF